MRRRFFFILLAIMMLGTIVYFYLNNFFLPVKVKAYIEQTASETIGRNVTIETIDFSFLQGVIIKNAFIHTQQNENIPEFVFPRISFNILFADIFKTKTIVVPALKFSEPKIPIHYNNNAIFNFSDILSKFQTPREKTEYSIIFKNLIIKNANISINDDQNDVHEDLSEVNLQIGLSLKKKIQFDADARLKDENSSFKITGEYDLTSQSIATNLNLKNIQIDQYTSYIKSSSAPLFENALIKDATLFLKHNASSTNIEGTLTTNNLTTLINESFLSGTFDIKGVKLNITNGTINGQGLLDIRNLILTNEGAIQLVGNIKGSFPKFSIKDGNIYLTSDNLICDQLTYTPTLKQKISTSLQSTNLIYNKNTVSQTLTGSYILDNTKVTFENATQYIGNLVINNLNLSVKENNISLTGDLASTETQLIINNRQLLNGNIATKNISIKHSPNSTAIDGEFRTADFTAYLTKDITLVGNPSLIISLESDSTPNTPVIYEGNLNLTDATLLGVQNAGTIEHINGQINFINDRLDTTNLTINALNTQLSLFGEVVNFKNPSIKGNLSTKNLDLKYALETAKPYVEFLQKNQDLSAEGSAEASFNLVGKLSSLKDATMKISLQPKNASLKLPGLSNTLERLNGHITFDKSSLSLNNITADYNNTNYTLNANYQNGTIPVLQGKLSSNELTFNTNIEFNKDTIKITNLVGKYYDTSFNFTGTTTTSSDNPIINLNGQANLNLENLKRIPYLNPKLNNLSIAGKANINTNISGPIKIWQKLNITSTIQSDKITLFDLPLLFADLKYTQSEQDKSKIEFTSSLYTGSLVLLSTIDLTDPEIPFKINSKLTNLDLAEMRKERNFSMQHLSGKLTVYFDGFGPLARRGKIEGKGYFGLTNGYLGQLIPYYKEAHFTDAQANFYLANGRIITSDGDLFSNIVNISLNGWIDFEKNYRFKASPSINDVIISKSKNIKIDPSMLIKETINLTCEGTLPLKPKCTPQASPKKIINNTGDMLRKGIGNIIDGLL